MESQTSKSTDNKIKARDMWFEHVIEELRRDQQALNLGIASEEKERMYDQIINNSDELMNDAKNKFTEQLLRKAIIAYAKEISIIENKPIKLALDHSDTKLLVFAIINDEDEKAENGLLCAAAEINHKFRDYGIHVSTTIIEESDNYPIPQQYALYIGNA